MNGTLFILPCLLFIGSPVRGGVGLADVVYDPGKLKPVDSRLKVRVGEKAPGFTLPSVGGGKVSLEQFRGRRNVMISFVPAAFTPVCSAQWPGYSLVGDLFESHDTVVLGITTDNIPSLHAWIRQMGGLDFEVVSDFHPQGAVARKFGVLRSDGTAERALFLIDKSGVIRWIDVHDINQRPPLEDLVAAMERLQD
jgi:peroxiredoxin (alkyl hydroperoxide reductase subunit C)